MHPAQSLRSHRQRTRRVSSSSIEAFNAACGTVTVGAEEPGDPGLPVPTIPDWLRPANLPLGLIGAILWIIFFVAFLL